MKTQITRRDFLKLISPLALTIPLLAKNKKIGEAQTHPAMAADQPNILILVYDALAADHMSVYGYPRETTPNLSRFAESATVYHSHIAGGNFTTTGTATLLTGAYAWSHRAFNVTAPVDDAFLTRNLFAAFEGTGHYRMAYTHNWLANFFLKQFQGSIDLLVDPESFYLLGTPPLHRLLDRDERAASRSSYFLFRIVPTEREKPGSLFFSLLNEMALKQYEASLNPELRALFPEGFPEEEYSKSFFLLEHAIDGIMGLVKQAPVPFLGYFHLYPPHFPYNPRREFIGKFTDGWAPAEKPPHFLSNGESSRDLARRRQYYDEYLAYADSEFGRLYDYFEQAGILENTYIIFTSDHGEMFERGIKGHNTPVLYNPLVRIPLLIHSPGQSERGDVYESTSCTDILPTLLKATGQPVPEWCEGAQLPGLVSEDTSGERVLYSIDSRQNPKYGALKRGTLAMVKGSYKLIYYAGYPGYERNFELYDLAEDPEEIRDVFQERKSIASELKEEFEAKLKEVNEPYL